MLATNADPTKSYTHSEWQQFCSEWEHSDEPQEKFCQRRGISYNSFVYWRGKLLKSSNKKFVPVKVPPEVSCLSSGLSIALPNGVRIINITDEQTLLMVLSLLGVKP